MSQAEPIGVTQTTAASLARRSEEGSARLLEPWAAPASAGRLPPIEHPRDAVHALLLAAGELDLTDAQKSTLETLEQRLAGREQLVTGDIDVLRADLSAEIRLGALDLDKLDHDAKAASVSIHNRVAGDIGVLQRLYDLLSPTQRKAAVARAYLALNSAGSTVGAASPPAGAAGNEQVRFEVLSRSLGLDAAQQKTVLTRLERYGEPKSELDRELASRQRALATVTAFGSAAFDPGSLLSAPDAASLYLDSTHRDLRFIASLLPVLSQSQQADLAKMVESGGS
jgi:hypothetical protein